MVPQIARRGTVARQTDDRANRTTCFDPLVVSRKQPYRFTFLLDDVYPSGDEVAEFALRCSLALADLRIAARYLGRRRQRRTERLYFLRLLGTHLREATSLIREHPESVIPSVEEFIAGLPAEFRERDSAEIARLREAAIEVQERLAEKLEPPASVTVNKALKEIRDRFAHYHYDKRGTKALRDALSEAGLAGEKVAYIVFDDRPQTDSEFADQVGIFMAHPMPGMDVATRKVGYRQIHESVSELVGPVSTVLQLVESLWLHSRPQGVVKVRHPSGRISDVG